MKHTTPVKAPTTRAAEVLREVLEPFGVFEARADEFGQVYALAARLISPEVASQSSVSDGKTDGFSIFVVREQDEVTGFNAFIYLNAAGLGAMVSEVFDTRAPQPQYLSGPGQEAAAIYCWGIAAANAAAARTLVQSSWEARAAFPTTPYFVRAATDAGLRLLTQKMDFVPYPGSESGLLWWPVYDARQRAA